VFSIPTLRGEVFFLILSSLGLALLVGVATDPLPVSALGAGIGVGMASGMAHVLAISSLPRQLSNGSADAPARRLAFLATRPGKLYAGIDMLVGLLLFASIVGWPLQLPMPVFAACWVARFAVSVISLLPNKARRP